MPAIYTSFAVEETDDLDTKARKLYLGTISLGEDLYTFNADVNQLKKRYEELDRRYHALKADQQTFSTEVKSVVIR